MNFNQIQFTQYMKSKAVIYFLVLFTFLSCSNQKEKTTGLNSFLQASYEFNTRILNQYRGDYHQMIIEAPSLKKEALLQLETAYDLLISKINAALATKETNLEKITLEANRILNEIPKMVDNRKDYIMPEDKVQKSNSDVLYLMLFKR